MGIRHLDFYPIRCLIKFENGTQYSNLKAAGTIEILSTPAPAFVETNTYYNLN